MEVIPLYVGYDAREAVAYHSFCQSVIDRCSMPVSFTPLINRVMPVDGKREGSNDFIYSRFLVPHMHTGLGRWAIYADGDMVCKADIAELWALRDDKYSVMVCKHDYKTKANIKYLGNKNEDYPRKNWSSLILFNVGGFRHLDLTPKFVSEATGAFLHRFQWLKDEEIGSLPLEWNWLAEEYPENPQAKLVHYTLGIPAFPEYKDCDHSAEWREAHTKANEPIYTR